MPGTEAALALGMANVIISSGLVDDDFVEHYAFGYEDWQDEAGARHKGFKSLVLEKYDLKTVAELTGLSSGTIARLAGEFAANRPALAVIPAESTLLTGSANGLYTAMAVHCLNALVGSIETPGGVQVQRYPACPGWPALPPDPAGRKRAASRAGGRRGDHSSHWPAMLTRPSPIASAPATRSTCSSCTTPTPCSRRPTARRAGHRPSTRST